jgi:hypothetical protein
LRLCAFAGEKFVAGALWSGTKVSRKGAKAQRKAERPEESDELVAVGFALVVTYLLESRLCLKNQ